MLLVLLCIALTDAQFSLITSTNTESVSPGTATITLSGAVLQSAISIQVQTLQTGSAAGNYRIALYYYACYNVLLICGLHAGSIISGVGDFMMTTSILMFNAGDGPGTVQIFNVPIVDDDLVENQEDINVSATIIGGSGSFFGGETTATGAINILDDDGMSWLLCWADNNS